MKVLLTIYVLVIFLLVANCVFGQDPFLQLPRTSDEANQTSKNVEDQSIPVNQPGLVYEEIRVARQKAEQYTDAKSRSLPQFLQQLDSSKGVFQQTSASWQQSAKECQKTANSDQLKQQLQQYVNFGVGFGTDSQNLPSEIRKLLSMQSKDLCKALATEQEIQSLRSASDADTDKLRQLYTQQITFADQLQKAWSGRLAKLEKLQTDQLQTYDLQRMVPYLVGIVCLFAVLMFYGLTKYDKNLQMELVTSGQMIQFPTVMILLVIIVALAIPKTISENTVSALLGGIAGYVLSQGVGRAVAREAERRAAISGDTPPSNGASPTANAANNNLPDDAAANRVSDSRKAA
jgi:hypothetical protein